MKTLTINEKDNWSYPWTQELKDQLVAQKENTSVGEKLLLETDTYKVWNIELHPGHALPFHKHNKPYCYVAKNSGKSRSFYGDGAIIDTEYQKNDTKHFEQLSDSNFFVHNLENIGDTTLIFTTIEFK